MGYLPMGLTGMEPGKRLFVLLFAALMLLNILGSAYWHEFGMERPSAEAYFEYYDSSVKEGSDACLMLALASENSEMRNIVEERSGRTEHVVVSANKRIFADEEIEASGKREYCIPAEGLNKGENIIEVSLNSGGLFFHVINGAEPERIELNAENFETKTGPAGISPFFGVALFIILFGALLRLFLSRTALLEAALLSLVSICAMFIAVPWALDMLGIGLNFYSVYFACALLLVPVYYVFRAGSKARRSTGPHTEDSAVKHAWAENRELLILFLVFGVALAILPLTTPSHTGNWNVFYERQAEMIVNAGEVPAQDGLSYLGRGLTFVWGYFLFNSSLAFVTGLSGTALFALVYFLVNSLLFLAVLYFIRSFSNFSTRQGAVFYLLIVSSLFIFVNLMISPKHILGFALLFAATAMLMRGRNPLIIGGTVALAAFTQASFLLLFPLTAIIVCEKIPRRALAVSALIAAVFFALLFAPIFAQHGMPYEIESTGWGYLIKHNFADLLVDLGQVVVLLFAYTALRVLGKWQSTSFYTKKLFIAGVLLVLMQMFVFYRINIVTHLVLTLLLFNAFAQDFKERHFRHMLIALGIIALLANLVIVAYSVSWEEQTAPMDFLRERTAPGERVLADPYYAHLATYFAKRPVLADLYVEYADAEKLNDAYRFILDEDETILRKYDIRYTLTEDARIFTDAKTQHYFSARKEFGFMDKVYTNGIFSIHRAR
ncbi:hypothetical protein KKH30_03390 [Candidatus Micrarchaeota archaeon]|nr:hypothetical protein [Candidatus Micrarchaeota archaeon]